MTSPAAGEDSQSAAGREFLSYDQAQPLIRAMHENLPGDLRSLTPLAPDKWQTWVRHRDADIRARLDRGEEDTLTNLLRFGVSYTSEYRIDDEYLLKYGQSSLVNSFAENRANDLIRAMSSPTASEGIAHMREFLEKRGYSFKTPGGRKGIRAYLLANLARMREEIKQYTAEIRESNRSHIFESRGISLDTNLWPDFLIDWHLASMIEKGLLRPRTVHRVAIVGPGLDFANKQMGYDFYPPQTIQPFAVLDSLVRLGLSDPRTIEVCTLDISPDVNAHLRRARQNAEVGRAYVVQLPWNTSVRMTPEYRRSFTAYWQRLGSKIGESIPPIPVPEGASDDTQIRALRIRPEIVLRVSPHDDNIVFEHLALAPRAGFDLIIGTNIFIYFSEFEQSLARLNMASMLNAGGFILSNDKLPNSAPDGLSESLQTTQIIARVPYRVDYMFTYQRQD